MVRSAHTLSRLGITGTPDGTKFLRDDGSWQALTGGGDALIADPLSQFASTTSSQLLGVISDETGTGLLVFATSPTLTTPVIGDFTSSIHDHEDASGGGQFDMTLAGNATGTPSASTFLRGDNSWSVPSGSGDVSKFGTPVDNQLGVWTDDGIIEGDAELTFDESSNTFAIAGVSDTSVFQMGGSSILVDSPRGTMTMRSIDAIDSTTEATIEAALDTLANVTAIGSGGSNLDIGGGATACDLRLLEPSGGGTNYTGFVAPALAGNVMYTLPIADGTASQFLQTNGSGTLDWSTPSGSGDMVLADVQTVTGAKTFEDGTFLLRNVADDFSSQFMNTNTASRTYTLQDSSDVLVGRDTTDTLTNKSIVATQLTGEIDDARLSSNVPLLDAANFFSGANIFSVVANSFIGLTDFSRTSAICATFTRFGTETTSQQSVFTVNHSTTGDMGAGFGPMLGFEIDDPGVTDETIGQIGFVRGTGDDDGEFIVNVALDGTLTERFVINEGGIFDFKTGAITNFVYDEDGTGNAITNIDVASIKSGSSLIASAITIVIDGGGSTITTGVKVDIRVPFGATIDDVEMYADQTGSIVVDIFKDTFANFPPVVGDSITASAQPTISSSDKSQDSTLTGWTTTITADDILRFNVDSVTSIQRLTVSLKITRT